MNITIPNCTIEDDTDVTFAGEWVYIRSNLYDFGISIPKSNLESSINRFSDFHDSYTYITDFLILNGFQQYPRYHIFVIQMYNSKLNIKADIYFDGYGINYEKRYKSYEFLEIIREMLGLNDINKLVIKE